MRHFIVIAAASLAVAACDLSSPAPTKTETSAEAASAPAPTPAPPRAFAHSQTGDLSGYYFPGSQVGPDDFQLTTVFVGQEAEFKDWEDGKRMTTFAPVMLEFLVPGETTERVLPDSYTVTDGHIRMTGASPDYGRVTLDAQLDQGSLSTARRNLGEGDSPVMTGVITIGDRTFSGIKFIWSGGD